MDERILQFRVGVMVAATLLITAILVATFGDLPTIVYGGKTYHIWVDSAPGVQADTPVRKSGILIGRVTEVKLADDYANAEQLASKLGISPDRFRGGVVITASVHRDREIYSDETFLVNATLLGDVVIEVTKKSKLADNGAEAHGDPAGGDEAAGDPRAQAARTPVHLTAFAAEEQPRRPIEDNAWVVGEKAVDPTEGLRKLESRLPEVFTSVKQTSDELNELIRSVNDLLKENRTDIDQAVRQTTETMTSIRRLADNANAVIGDPETQRNLQDAMQRLPRILGDVHDTVLDIRGSIGQMNRALTNIEDFTRPLSERSDVLVGGLETSIRRLDVLLAELVEFSQSINDRHGTLGRLVHDPELYNNLNQTVLQVKCLTRKLEPILDDARVFSDKVARHPGVIVRDAVRPGTGLK